MLIGMIAGSILGIITTTAAMPYMKPQIRRALRKGKKYFNQQLDKMNI